MLTVWVIGGRLWVMVLGVNDPRGNPHGIRVFCFLWVMWVIYLIEPKFVKYTVYMYSICCNSTERATDFVFSQKTAKKGSNVSPMRPSVWVMYLTHK
jgi:hypothetical protein